MARPALALTDQQQAIVAHTTGPALVIAVAGAGKTTAMVHRIAHLVRSGVFPAHQILATSFNRDANEQVRKALRRWPSCEAVRVQTLHGLGYGIVKLAVERDLLPPLTAKGHLDTSGRRTLRAAIDLARSRGVAYAPMLDAMDYDDFLNQVGVWKANLAYADLRDQGLPRAARKVARQARPPADKPWYLDFYRLYEAVRIENRWLTFDDMLLTAWEVLVSHPEILAMVQRRYRCVMVDEYQDVNLAQAEMLDLLVRPHGNFMAIGDDDQTIYEWRGASPDFFLAFAKRYRAAVYYMTENFRGHASHLTLANQVIQHNRRRQPKRLDLVRGFGGTTTLSLHGSAHEQAFALARDLKALLAQGVRPREIGILVRVYAQTPPIEEALRGAGIPYEVVGDVPFYQRNAAGSHGKPPPSRPQDCVTIISIFRAKGMEWPVVCVPDCNDRVLPLAKAQRPEEERRLFYVALTRARERLFLYALQGKPLSPYLLQANYAATLAAAEAVGAALDRDPSLWQPDDYLAVGVNAKRLYLLSYLARHWPADPATRAGVAHAILAFYALLRKRRLLRKLQLGRDDIRFWQEMAGARLTPPPLDLPGMEEMLRKLGKE
jgi:superfamily I DNA/RNA helicase